MNGPMIMRRDTLPAALAKSSQDMELFRQGDAIAIDVASDVYAYNFNRAASTLAFTGLVYKAAREFGLPPGAEEGLRELTQEYLSAAKSITHLANTEIILSMGEALTTRANGDEGTGNTRPVYRLDL